MSVHATPHIPEQVFGCLSTLLHTFLIESLGAGKYTFLLGKQLKWEGWVTSMCMPSFNSASVHQAAGSVPHSRRPGRDRDSTWLSSYQLRAIPYLDGCAWIFKSVKTVLFYFTVFLVLGAFLQIAGGQCTVNWTLGQGQWPPSAVYVMDASC